MKSANAALIILAPVLFVLAITGSGLAQSGVPGAMVVGEIAPLSAPMAAPSLSPLGQVERRLLVCEERLARWRELAAVTASPELAARRPVEWAGCYAALEGLVGDYGRLKEQVAHRHEVGLGLWQILGDDIAFLEGECPQVYRRAADLLAGGGAEVVPPGPHPVAAPGLPVVVEVPPLGESEQLVAWNTAVGLFDAGKYEEVIPELAGLVNTSAYGGVAKEKLLKAQTEVAKQLRSQAAATFVRARKSETPAQKKKLLEESWALLNKIVTTYPEVAIIDKVKQNLSQIEDQLEDLDPASLQQLKGLGREKS